jgi:uncharacterized repeat protein (TIGR03803 family)
VNVSTIYYFSGYNGSFLEGNLTLVGNTFYGTTSSGGPATNGTVYAVNMDGSSFRTLHNFSGHDPVIYTNTDGFWPYSGVAMANNVVYGTTWGGGFHDEGVIYSILVEPMLTITRAGTNVVVSWPTNYTGYSLHSATNLAPPVNWSAVAGQYFVTNAISAAKQKFYLLSNP